MPDPMNTVQSGLPSRIIFVRQQFSAFGGGELILNRTISALRERGVNISLLGRSWAPRDDIELIACNPPRSPRFSRERRFASAACERLKHERALVQSHERIPCCDIFRAGDGSHAAYIEHRSRGAGKIAAALLRLNPYNRNVIALEREMFTGQRLRAVIVNSRMVADEITRLYSVPAEKIHLVQNGIDLDRFNLQARATFRENKRKEIGVDGNRPALLFVGSGYKRKGLDTAIRALAKSRADAEIWVAGSDKNPAAYEALAAGLGLKGRIRLMGPVQNPVPLYAAADALILPTIYDPFPSTALEALACGLPVITSTGCGARDLAAKIDPSLVCDAYDTDAFARAIPLSLELASRPETRSRANTLTADFSIDSMIEKLLSMYRKLV